MFKRAIGAYLLMAATQGWALSLGASSGAVTIGQALDVQVRTTADAAEWASGLCLQAEVYFGESRLPASSVDLVAMPGQGEYGAVRVRSRTAVNEPIVTVVLSAGCVDKFGRRYVFLSDFEPAVATIGALVVPTLSAAGLPASEAAVSGNSTSTSPTDLGKVGALVSTGSTAQPAIAAAPASSAPVAPAKAAPKPAVKPSAPTQRQVAAQPSPPPAPKPATAAIAQSTGPRLKLEPLDLSPAQVGRPTLKAQTELLTEPTTDQDRRTEVNAAWAALNATPDQWTQDREKVAALEKQLESMRQEQQRMAASVESYQAQWKAAEDQRYQNPLVYGLLVALLVALGLWWRTRKQVASISNSGQGAWWESTLGPVSAHSSATLSASDSVLDATDSVVAAGLHALEQNGLDAISPENEAVHSAIASPATIDNLLDMVQQVDFFESLGQFFDAQRILKDFVAAHPASCEVPYLLWLRHAKEMGDARQRVDAATAYQQHFQAEAPPFSAYARQAPGLDSDSALLAELALVWGRSEGQALLERALLSVPGDGRLNVRTLEAFEDLFMLYAVAQAIHAEPGAQPAHPSIDPSGGGVASNAAASFAPTVAMDLPWQPAPEEPVRPIAGGNLIDLDMSGFGSNTPPFQGTGNPRETADSKPAPDVPALDFDFDLPVLDNTKASPDKPAR